MLDGRAVAAQWQEELAREVASMRARGLRRPGLGVVLVGERPDSQLYVARKQEACSRVGRAGGRAGRGAWGERGKRCECGRGDRHIF